ncbi:MAG: hypothetical protein RR256_03990, partial [Bacteroidales bacterium]
MKTIDKQAQERYLNKLRLIKENAAENPFETKEEQMQRIEKAKKDVAFFVRYYFPHYATAESADFQLKLANRVAKSKTCTELVRWGRGLAKSVWCDTILPIWLYARGERLFCVLVGNNYAAAKELLSGIQAEFEANARLLHDFGKQKCIGTWEEGNFTTKDGRFMGKALGMGQSPRGLRKMAQRPNYIVADDLEDKETIKNPNRQDEIVTWIEKDLLPTMDGDTRRYLHPNNDFAPRTIQNRLQTLHPNWHVDTIKAYDKETYLPAWSSKYNATYYQELEHTLGPLAAHAEYLHEPVVEGKIFTSELFVFAKMPPLNHFKIIVGHWDVAYSGKNDYNAVKVWGLHGLNFWHLKSFCKQCKMEEAVRFMYEYEKTLPPSIRIVWRVESQFWNEPVKQAIEKVRLEYNRFLNLSIVTRSTTHKYERMLSMHPYYQGERIYYNIAEEANPSMQEGIQQTKGIEPGYHTHDDGPDADQQAIEFLSAFVNYNHP